MQIFDLKKMESHSYAEREKNVFYKTSSFKVRIIELPPNGEMPTCKMDSYVMFYVLKGEVDIDINQEKKILSEGQCFITEPATLSMRTKNGVKILGVQITQQ
jgi:quercetin dioxygenase-like cupin family protein